MSKVKVGARLLRRSGETPAEFRLRCITEVSRIDPRHDVTDAVLSAVADDCGRVIIIWPDADHDAADSDPLVH